MQHNGTLEHTGLSHHSVPLLVRFFGKFVLDILPGALASVIGGFLFTQYQFGHTAAPQPAAEQVTPASAEMMQLVRDEHAMILNYLKTQTAAEKSRLAADDKASARAEAEAKTAEAKTAEVKTAEAKLTAAGTRHLAAAAVVSKAAAARSKAPAVASVVIPTHAPLAIAQAEPNDGAASPAPAAAPPRDPNPLLAKTLEIRDNVVDATRQAVSVIGSIPSWIASMGDRIGGAGNRPDPDARQQFSAAS